ncbi:MAG: DUF6069 family protein [Candidatus Kariarchaeaceae archaeon]|jgi:hypothetical protein
MEDFHLEFNKLWKVGLTVIFATVIVNILLFFIGDAFDAFPEDALVSSVDEPITIEPVIMSSVMFTTAGILGFAILVKLFNQSLNAIRYIAIAVVVLTFLLPITGIENAPAKMIFFLELMHVAAGLIVIPGLTSRYLWDRF